MYELEVDVLAVLVPVGALATELGSVSDKVPLLEDDLVLDEEPEDLVVPGVDPEKGLVMSWIYFQNWTLRVTVWCGGSLMFLTREDWWPRMPWPPRRWVPLQSLKTCS